MRPRATSLLLAFAAASSLLGAASATASPTLFERGLTEPAVVGAYEGTVVYISGSPATMKRSINSFVPEPFAAGVALGNAPRNLDLGPAQPGTISFRDHMPVTLLRVGDALVTVNSVNGNPSKVSTVQHRPAPTGDVAIYRGHAAYVAGRGKNKRVILLTRVGDEEGTVVARGDIRSIDLGRSKLAYVDGESGFSNKVRVHLVDLATGRDRVIDQVGSGEMSVADFQKPSFTADNKSLIYSETRWGAGGQYIHKYDLATRKLSRAPGTDGIFAAGWVDDAIGLAYSTYDVPTGDCEAESGECVVGYTGPLRFKAER